MRFAELVEELKGKFIYYYCEKGKNVIYYSR